MLDHRGSIPSFIHVSNGKLHDVHALDVLLPEAGAIYVMDRAYVDFGRLHRLHRSGAFFVTRAKSNMNARRVYSAASDCASGVIADQTIALDDPKTQQGLSRPSAAYPLPQSRQPEDLDLPDEPYRSTGADHLLAL